MSNLKNLSCIALLLSSCTTAVQEHAPLNMEQDQPLPITAEVKEIKIAPERTVAASRKNTAKAPEKKTEVVKEEPAKPLMQRKHPVEGYEANPYKDEFQVD